MSDSLASAEVSSETQVAEIVDTFMDELARGERPQVEDYARRHPQFADVLRKVLPALQVMGPPPAGDAEDSPLTTGVLGDFRILREVGRGGMGVVYEAEQMSLKRRVALKVLPFAGALDARQLQRFKNESQAAAQLHHTNIVPVHYVGCERGVHFYAMQFIEGNSLADVIAQLRASGGRQGPKKRHPDATTAYQGNDAFRSPAADTPPVAALSSVRSTNDAAYFRTAAEWGIQAAEALDYAHQQGIVHRDVKPANLMVDAAGRLWITDFGLAQVQSDARLTMTGDLVGTLRYMSPEQALAKRVVVDHRTDVYSLGATLYELLTLEPVFRGTDRQELLRQIAFEEPALPRRLNNSIPAELETIVLKAIEKNPADRYATAQELANDLRHWLEDRPIQARRPSLAKRLTKWARRHKAVVSVGGGVACAALLVLLLGLLWHEGQLREAAERERKLREDAEAQREDAMAKRNMAHRAVDKMYTQVATRLLEQEPQQSQLQREFLEEALRFYQELAQDASEDPTSAFDVAVAYRRLAKLNYMLGNHQESEQEFAKANAMLERLAEQSPERSEYRRELATSYSDLGSLLLDLIRRDDAERVIRKAVGINEQFLAEFPDDPALRQQLAGNYGKLGTTLAGWRGGRARPREAEDAFRQALGLREKLAEAFPNKPDYRSRLGGVLSDLAALLMFQERSQEARKLVERAVEEQVAARKLNPRHPIYRLYLSNHLTILADLLDASGEAEEAVKVARRTVEVRERLAADWPDVQMYRRNLADDYRRLASRLTDRSPQEAESVALQAVSILEQLLRDHPQNPMYQDILANVQLNLGHARYRAGAWRGALAALQHSLKLRPDGSGSCYLFLAMSHWRLGHQKEAQDWFDRAVARMKMNGADEKLRRVRAEAEALLSGKQLPESQPKPVSK